MFASSAIYRRDILQEKMEIENFLDVLYYNVHKLILQNLTFNLCMDKKSFKYSQTLIILIQVCAQATVYVDFS